MAQPNPQPSPQPNPLLERVIQDVDAFCRPLRIPVLYRHEEVPSPQVRVEISPEPDGIVRVILYPGPLTDDAKAFGEQLDAALIQLFTEYYTIVETVRGDGYGNTWRVVAKPA